MHPCECLKQSRSEAQANHELTAILLLLPPRTVMSLYTQLEVFLLPLEVLPGPSALWLFIVLAGIIWTC